MCAECKRIDAGIGEIVHGFAAQEFAADFVMRAALTLKKSDFPARSGKAHSGHGACQAAAYDQVRGLRSSAQCGVPRQLAVCSFSTRDNGFRRATHRRAGLNDSTRNSLVSNPAAAHICSHSGRTNARAIEAGPSFCTNG